MIYEWNNGLMADIYCPCPEEREADAKALAWCLADGMSRQEARRQLERDGLNPKGLRIRWARLEI